MKAPFFKPFMNFSQSNRRGRKVQVTVLVMAGLLAWLPQAAHAGNNWTGGTGGTGTSWNDPLNWGGAMPATNGPVYFTSTGTGSGTKVITLDAPQTILSLNFNSYSAVPTFTIGNAADQSAGNTLTLTNVFRGDNNSNTQTIAANVILAADSTWNIVNGYNGSVNVTGGIGSAAAVNVTKEGSNTLDFRGVNTFTGSLRVLAGTLTLSNTNAYTGTSTASGGSLNISFPTSTATNLIQSASPLVFGGIRGGGSMTVTGKNVASSLNSQTFNGLTLNSGASSFGIVNGISSGKTLVALGAITRNVGSTLNFAQPTVNTAISFENGYTSSTGNDISNILGAYATVGNVDWAANNATNIVAYTGYTVLIDANPNIIDASTSNVRISSGSTGDVGQAAGTVTINTLNSNDAAARIVTVGSGNTLRLGAIGGVLSTGTAGLTIGAAGNAGTLTAGGVDNSPGELILNNSTPLFVNSLVTDNGTGAVSLTKSGVGTTTLAATNTYGGGTTVNAGIVAFAGSTVLSGTTTNSSTTLTVDTTGMAAGQSINGLNIPANTKIVSITDATHLVLSQSTNSSGAGTGNVRVYTGGTTDALSTSGGIALNGGTIEFGSTSASQSTSGAIVIAGGTLNNGTLTKTGANFDVRGGTVSTKLAGAVGLDKTTPGTVTFANTVANTYTGTTTITEGSVVVGIAANVTAISGKLVVGSPAGGNPASFSIVNGRTDAFNRAKNLTIYSNGSVSLGGGAQNFDAGITIIGGSISGSFNYVNSDVSMTGGTFGLTALSGTNGTYHINASASTANITGVLANQNATFNVADGAAATDLLFSGTLGGVNKLTKTGAGKMVASGASGYTGATTISGGTLVATTLKNGGTTDSSIGKAANTAVNLKLGNGATLQYLGTGDSTDRLFTIDGSAAGHSATLDASGAAALNFTNVGNVAYGITNQTRTLILAGTSTADNTLAPLIANNGSAAVSVTKNDAGKWILTGANTYTGNTTVNGGTLVLANGSLPSALDDASTVTIADGAVLHLPNAGTDIVGSLLINGIPQPNGVYGNAQTSAITGAGKIQVGTIVASPFEDWMSTKYPSLVTPDNEAGADPDKDGSINILEFATDGDPTSGAKPGKVFSFIADSDGDTLKELILTVAVRKTAPAFVGSPSPVSSVDGITYIIQGSLNLDGFTSNVTPVAPVVPVELPTPGADYEYRSFKLDASSGLSGHGFLRLMVTEP